MFGLLSYFEWISGLAGYRIRTPPICNEMLVLGFFRVVAYLNPTISSIVFQSIFNPYSLIIDFSTSVILKMLMHFRKCLFSRNPLEYNFKRILFSRFSNDSKDNKFSEKISASENATTNTEASLDSSVLGKVLNMFDMVEKRTSETIAPVTADLPIKAKTSFAKLLRNSSLIQIGDPNGRLVVGTVIETLDDNLFIDFGGKFHCVCKKPRTKPE